MMVPGRKLQVFSIKVEEKNDEKRTLWVKAGSAWVNRDGSLNVYLDVLPLDGKLHVREAVDEKRAESNNNSRAASTNGSSAQEANSADSMGGH